MAGRNRMPHHALNRSRNVFPPEDAFIQGHGRQPPQPVLLEEELEFQLIGIRRLMGENRTLVEQQMALQQELGAAEEELRRMNFAISDIQAEQETRTRELIGKGLKLEANFKEIEPLKSEVSQLYSEVKKLNALRQDLAGQVQNLTKDLARIQAENRQFPLLRQEIDGLQQELMYARAALEYEKEGGIELMEHKQAMEKNLISMAREVEKLRSDLVNADSGLWGPGGSYGTKLGVPEGAFPAYGDGYGAHLGFADKAPT